MLYIIAITATGYEAFFSNGTLTKSSRPMEETSAASEGWSMAVNSGFLPSLIHLNEVVCETDPQWDSLYEEIIMPLLNADPELSSIFISCHGSAC